MTEFPLNAGERAARDARRGLGIPETVPIADLLALVESRCGIPVLIEPFSADHIAGVILRQASGDSFVGINADHGPVKQRFTLAHEVGHVEMGHQPRVELVADLFGGRTRDGQEVEANYFAAEFLAPRPAVRQWVEDRDLLGKIDADAVARLALSFGVSFPTTCYRLERAGLIGTTAKNRLVDELRAHGSSLARRHRDERLMDVIESLCRDKAYPRVPKQTTDYAATALDDGLIDEDEYDRIVSKDAGLDFASWFE